jgi:NADPH:quinone reductase-like Zn-dependent oxidoreductase
MKAAIQDRYGPPEVVRIDDIEKPTPGEGEILVRVHAASVNRADLDGLGPRPGFLRPFIGLRAPRSHAVGIDVAGVVDAVGEGVQRFKPGDRVFADLFGQKYGAFAEYAAAPEKVFQSMPDGMSFEEAATLPHSAVLAVQGLRLRDGRTPKTGDRVCVVGASGNVGPFAVQIAKAMGTEVTGVASTEKSEMVRSLGADHVIDYKTTDYTKTGQRYDWIVDTDSHNPIRDVRRALAPGGVYLALGGSTWPLVRSLIVGGVASFRSSKTSMLMLWWKPFHPPDVERLNELIAAGKLRPVIDRRYPLDQVVDALRWVDDGHAKGKVVITVVPQATEATGEPVVA